MTNRLGDIIKFREHSSFLGYEFLNWLLLLLETTNSSQEVVSMVGKHFVNTDVGLVLGMRVTTCLLNHKEQKTTITCPLLEESHEVYASLKNGHVIESLSLVAALGEMKVNFMLHAQDGAITQVKISANYENEKISDDEDLSEEDQAREDIFLRTAHLEDIEKIIDELYDQFLSERVDGKRYPERQQNMRGQVELRLANYLRKGGTVASHEQNPIRPF